MHFSQIARLAAVAVPIALGTQAYSTPLLYGNYYEDTRSSLAGTCTEAAG
jgi:hypothetical protein